MTMTTRKFYKTVFTMEVLSEEPIPDTLSIGEVDQECIGGSYSGKWVRQPEVVLNGTQAADALREQGSSPEFFNLTEEGEDAV